ncbi:MAG: ABC transporter ATP-binding protein [Ruminiclostridium sp.]
MIELRNVSAGYSKTNVIKDINIKFEKNTITSIIGPNGCGKSTLLQVLAKNLVPAAGDVYLNDKLINYIPRKEYVRYVSILPQSRDVNAITVYNLVMHGRFPYMGFPRYPTIVDKEKVHAAMEMTGILQYKNRSVDELSGGERQKIYLAMVIAQDTDIVLLDEPATYLDINYQLETLSLLENLKKDNKTIITVMHDIPHALSISDKVCLMEKGTITKFDDPNAIFNSKEIDRIFSVSVKNFEHNGEHLFWFSRP